MNALSHLTLMLQLSCTKASEPSTESSVDIVRCAFNNFFHNTICIVGMKVMFLKVFNFDPLILRNSQMQFDGEIQRDFNFTIVLFSGLKQHFQ